MAHPYFVAKDVFEDIPRLDSEDDKDLVTRKGEDSDDEIDNLLPSPLITVPLDTVPDVIKIASTLRTEGKIFQQWGELKRGQELIDNSTQMVLDYIKTFKLNSADRDAVVSTHDTTSSEFNFENSPIVDLEPT